MATRGTKKKTTKKARRKKTPRKKAAKKKTKRKAAKKKTTKRKNSRNIGHDFERLIAKEWRERFSDREWSERVRRTDQSHRAHLSDVHGVPGLWQECGKNRAADPPKKLEQAVHDLRGSGIKDLFPISVTRKLNAKDIEVGMRLSDLAEIIDLVRNTNGGKVPHRLVRMTLPDFWDVYDLAELDDGKRPTLAPPDEVAA